MGMGAAGVLVVLEQVKSGKLSESSGRAGTEGCWAAWDKANPGIIFPLQWSMGGVLCRGGLGLAIRLGFENDRK